MKSFALCIAVFAALAGAAWAGEDKDKEVSSSDAKAETVVTNLIKQLNDEKLAVRDAATKKLAAMGKAAVPLLKQALSAKDLDAETAVRLRDIVAAHDKAEAAKKEVTDPATGLRVVIADNGLIQGFNGNNVYWSVSTRPIPEAIVLENGLIVLKPNNVAIDPNTGKLVRNLQK